MEETRLYLRTDILKSKTEFEDILREQYQDKIEITWQNNIAKITFYETISLSSIRNLFQVLSSDLSYKLCGIIVPKFDDVFLKYLKQIDSEIYTIYEIFIKNMNNTEIIEDSKYLLKGISQDYIKTVLVYLDCHMNGSLAAKELYLHRNSFNYRLDQFIYKSDIDIRNVNNMLFVKLIIELSQL